MTGAVGAVMSVHRLSAGNGFRYLLRDTASADVPRGQQTLVDYYVESGNPPGRWIGSGLAGLADGRGLAPGTVVSEAAMTAVFGRAVDPVTGVALGRPFPTRVGADGVARPAGVAGFDLTFTAVKSVSVLWALADDQTRGVVRAAHDAAVSQTLGLLETRVAATRVGHGGATRVGTRGVIAAAFDHPDTRHGDPNLHTHVVLANRVQGPDGAWRTLDGQVLFAAAVAMSETYDALLADELSRRLPVSFGWRDRGPRRTPAFEVDGIDDHLLAMFSTRSRDITTTLSALVADFHTTHGRGPTRVETIRLRQRATLATRPVKRAHAWSDLLTSWAQRARELTGREPRDLLAAALSGEYGRPLLARDIGPDSARDLAGLAVAGVEARRSTWNGWNLEAEIARVTKHCPMASAAERDRLHDSLMTIATGACVALDGRDHQLMGPADRLAEDLADHEPDLDPVAGDLAVDEPADSWWESMARRYTSPLLLSAEAQLLACATTSPGPRLDEDTALAAAAATVHPNGPATQRHGRGLPPLAPDQAAALVHATTSGRTVTVLVGPAGSGKTTTLAAIKTLWTREQGSSGMVVGLAPSATAADQLSTALGIRCETTAKWLYETVGPGAQKRAAASADFHARNAAGAITPGVERFTQRAQLVGSTAKWQFHAGQLVIIDEATLAGTIDLARIVTQARRDGAAVLLVGDHHQLSAVQAGGAFGLLARRTQTAELTGLWRFTHRWEAHATRALRHGDPTALDAYAAHGRLHDGTRQAMLDAAYTAWRTDTDTGRDSMLLAADTDTVTELNARARADNITTGRAEPDGVTLLDGTTAGVGDRVITRHNDRSLPDGTGGHIRNGATWTVTARNHDGSLDVTPAGAPTSPPTQVRLPADYVAEHLDLGYAITTHRIQSRTLDTAHVITSPGMTREHLYVALTRGRADNHTYIPLDDDHADDEAHRHTATSAQPTGREVLEDILATSSTETSATETLEAARRYLTPARRPQNKSRRLDTPRSRVPDGPGLTR